MPRWASPQAWNSGAATTTVSRARTGIVDRIDPNESAPPADDRAAPLGRPVVPDVRMTVRPGRLVIGRIATADRWAASSSSSDSPTTTAAPQPSTIGANSSSWRTTSIASLSTTSASCGPANPVLRNTRSAPSLAVAASPSTKPRWLRARIPTIDPGPTPRRRSPRATASLAAHSSPKVMAPRSSMRAGARG